MNQYTTNQPIGSTVGNNPVCPNCLPYDKCELHADKLNPPKNNCGEKYCSRIHPKNDEPPIRSMEQQLIDILINHCGEHGQNEGAVECLDRIIRERDLLLKRAVEQMLKPAHF
jgi:hypothetical protein